MGPKSRRYLLQSLGGATLVAATAPLQRAFAYVHAPISRPLKIIAQEVGGQTDTVARIFLPALARALSQDVIVENHPGASGRIAARAVVKAPPDGNTVGLGGGNNLVLATLLDRDPGYDVAHDFRLLAGVARIPFAIAVRNELPITDINDLVSYAKRHPGKLSYGSAGVGGSSHLTVAMIAHHHQLQMIHVPFRGSNLATTELIGDRIDIVATDLARLIPFARDGRLRIIAVAGNQRSPRWPQAGTLHEQGMPGFYLEPWYGLYGPRALSDSRTDQLTNAVRQAQLASDTRERTDAAGMEFLSPNRETVQRLIDADRARYAPLLNSLHRKVGQ